MKTADPATASTWLVNGSRARPINEPETSRLGQGTPIESQPPAPAGIESSSAAATPLIAASSATGALQEPATSRVCHDALHHNGDAAKHPLFPSARNGNGELHTPMKRQNQESQNGDPVIEAFQQTMQQFLEVQRSTMLAYLTGRGPAAPPKTPNINSDVKDRARNHQDEQPPAPRSELRGPDENGARTNGDYAHSLREFPQRAPDKWQTAERAEWEAARARSARG